MKLCFSPSPKTLSPCFYLAIAMTVRGPSAADNATILDFVGSLSRMYTKNNHLFSSACFWNKKKDKNELTSKEHTFWRDTWFYWFVSYIVIKLHSVYSGKTWIINLAILSDWIHTIWNISSQACSCLSQLHGGAKSMIFDFSLELKVASI